MTKKRERERSDRETKGANLSQIKSSLLAHPSSKKKIPAPVNMSLVRLLTRTQSYRTKDKTLHYKRNPYLPGSKATMFKTSNSYLM